MVLLLASNYVGGLELSLFSFAEILYGAYH